jgi:DNA anti-recombination protein RmuC
MTDNNLAELTELIKTQFDRIDRRFEKIDDRFQQIEDRFEKIDDRFGKLEEQIQTLAIGQAKIEARLDEWRYSIQKIPDLVEKMGELKNWKQIAIIVITVFGGGLFGWFLKGGRL